MAQAKLVHLLIIGHLCVAQANPLLADQPENERSKPERDGQPGLLIVDGVRHPSLLTGIIPKTIALPTYKSTPFAAGLLL